MTERGGMRSSLFASPSAGSQGVAPRGGTSREAAAQREAQRQTLHRMDEATVARENDEDLEILARDVARLKAAAAGMRDDVVEHNTFLDQMMTRFGSAATGVKRQTGQLDHVMRQYGCKHTMYLALAICATIIILYYVASAAWSAKKSAPAAT
jgi:hypothetical protein